MGTINQSLLPPGAQLVSTLREGQTKAGGTSFSQDVIINGKTMTVTLHYNPGTKISQETGKRDMEARIANVVTLANELGLGSGGLEKIQITGDHIMGKWHEEGGHKFQQDMVQKLKEDIASSQGDTEKLQFIEKKLQSIQTISQFFATLVQEPLHQVTTEAAKSAADQAAGKVSESPAQTIQRQEEEFNAAFQSASSIVSQLEEEEKSKFLNLLTQMNTLSAKIDTLMETEKTSPHELEEARAQIDQLRTEMNSFSSDLKAHFDERQAQLFSKQENSLETSLTKMTALYNQVVDRRKSLESLGFPKDKEEIARLKLLEKSMLNKISQCNETLGHTSLATNSTTITKSHAIAFFAVVEKKMSLYDRKLELQSKTTPKRKERKELRKIERELLKAPKAASLSESAEGLLQEITEGSNRLVCSAEAKKLHKAHPELKWGATYTSQALRTPANWTENRTALIKQSRSGRMHVSVSILTPLDIKEDGGVPASLRKDKRFSDRPANMMKTTSYICSEEGTPIGTHISFRGAQFPTTDSAKKALQLMIGELEKSGQSLENLHINALLTPTAFTMFKKDKLLLQAHRENIASALAELREEAKAASEDEKAEKLRKLEETLAISNLGVNEGAVGEQKVLGLRLRWGWHTSMADYTNEASQQLNRSVSYRLDEMDSRVDKGEMEELSQELDRLGPILQVGQELEAVFASNDYANAQVGSNQFKMPALWKTMDTLIGVHSYMNCMSGKDRTGKVESNAAENLDEIFMNITDQKQKLTRQFLQLRSSLLEEQQPAWDSAQPVLTSACFQEKELQELHTLLKEQGPEVFKKTVQAAIKNKIHTVRTGLGMERGPAGFMEEKRNIPRGMSLFGTQGIPTNPSKQSQHPEAQQQFPNLAVSSVYEQEPIDFVSLSSIKGKLADRLEDRQREAKNRRLSQLSGSLAVTQMNTGTPGFKVEGGEPLARFSSGFDRDFVLSKLLTATMNDPQFRFNAEEWMGLKEIGSDSRLKYLDNLQAIGTNISLSKKQKIQAWTKVLQEIEEEKRQSLAPQTKVKA